MLEFGINMRANNFLVALIFLTIGLSGLRAQGVATEFHEGATGYSVDFGGLPDQASYVRFEAGSYQFWGHVYEWEGPYGRLRVSSLSASDGKTLLQTAQRRAGYNAFLAYTRKLNEEEGLKITERPFTFAGSLGAELRAAGEVEFIERSFFFNGQLIIIAGGSSRPGALAELEARLDTFRVLTKNERVIALIDQFTPFPLPRESPANYRSTDALENHLKGPVAVVREFRRKSAADEPVFSSEHRYDSNGFLAIEVAFSSGYPDVITGWGWVDEKRVNRQSRVEIHADTFRVSSGRTVVSGAFGRFGSKDQTDLRYGIQVETEYDLQSRPVLRKNISNTGLVLSIVRFKYVGNVVERHETDADGGFIGSQQQTFDADGNVSDEVALTDSGRPATELRRFEYKFDDTGNWIERTAYAVVGRGRLAKKRTIEIITRDIRYHAVENRNVARYASAFPKSSG